jgi:GDP-L-fucose synthase
MKLKKNIFVAGANGMVGSALKKELQKNKENNVITYPRNVLDLTNQSKVLQFFKESKIDEIYLAAAKVGGIHANNSYPADFLYENIMIQSNVIHQAFKAGIQKLLFMGSSCIYPKLCQQPIKEEELLNGLLEPTNEPYAIAKISGIKLCESYNRQYKTDFRAVMPSNLYGINDNYHIEDSHVIPSLIRRFHDAKINNKSEVVVWGTGNAKREFLFSEDMASASIFIMNLEKETYIDVINKSSHINIGFGSDISIKELAHNISRIVGYKGKVIFDISKEDGTPRKILDSSKLKSIGWKPRIKLKEGLNITYNDFLQNKKILRM